MEKILPNGWVETEFGNYISLKNGYAYKTTQFKDSGIPILKISNITKNGKVDISNPQFVSKEDLNKSFLVENGDIVIAMSGATTGKFGIYEEDDLLLQNQRVGNIKLLSEKLGNKKFVYYLIASSKKEIEEKAYGGAQPNISPTLIESIKIPLPPLAEQERIVAKLDALFAQHEVMKNTLERIPQLLKDFRQQVLTKAVTGKLTEEWREGKDLESNNILDECEKLHWSKKEFDKYSSEIDDLDIIPQHKSWVITCPGHLCEKIVDGTHKTPNYLEEGIMFLSARNIKEGFISYENCKYISLAEHKELLKRCNPKKGSLLITKSGTIGRMAILNEDSDFSLFESVAVLTPLTENVNAKFLGYSINHYLINGGNEIHVKGTAVQHLHLNQLRILPICLPSTSEQYQIVSSVESLFAKAITIETRYQQLKDKIDTLPQALLHKAFKGELVLQLPTDGDAKVLLAEIMALKNEVKGKKK